MIKANGRFSNGTLLIGALVIVLNLFFAASDHLNITDHAITINIGGGVILTALLGLVYVWVAVALTLRIVRAALKDIRIGGVRPELMGDLETGLTEGTDDLLVFTNDNDGFVLTNSFDDSWLKNLKFNFDVRESAGDCESKLTLVVGPHGAGKKSLIYLKALYLKKNVYLIELDKVTDDLMLGTLLEKVPRESFIMMTGLEDIKSFSCRLTVRYLESIIMPAGEYEISPTGYLAALSKIKSEDRTAVVLVSDINSLYRKVINKAAYDNNLTLGELAAPVVISSVNEVFDIPETADIMWGGLMASDLNLVLASENAEEAMNKLKTLLG